MVTKKSMNFMDQKVRRLRELERSGMDTGQIKANAPGGNMPRKNPIAKNLRTRRFRLKVIKSKKVYNRSKLQNDEIMPERESSSKEKI